MKVALTVLVNPAGITPEEAAAEHASTGEGFCDGIFVASIEGDSVTFDDFDGRAKDGALNGGTLFYVWVRIAERLTQRAQLDPERHLLCQGVWELMGPGLTAMTRAFYATRKYHLRFNLFRAHEGADAVIVAQLDFKTIPFELVFASLDGHTNTPVPDNTWWEVWVCLAERIMGNYHGPPGAMELLGAVLSTVHRTN